MLKWENVLECVLLECVLIKIFIVSSKDSLLSDKSSQTRRRSTPKAGNSEGSQETCSIDWPAYKVYDSNLQSRKCKNSQAKTDNLKARKPFRGVSRNLLSWLTGLQGLWLQLTILKMQKLASKKRECPNRGKNTIYAVTMLEAWFAQEESDIINQIWKKPA